MKRSSNITLVLMGTAAFATSFAGGSALLAWKGPAQSQTCATAPDGAQTCTTSRSSAGYARYFHYSIFPDRTANALPAGQLANPGSNRVAGGPVAAISSAADGTVRAGFGSTARMAFRSSAAS
jgi:hypothetical protein